MAELRRMKSECEDNLKQMAEERSVNEDFKRQFRDLRESFNRQELKKEVSEVRESGEERCRGLRRCLEAVVMDVKAFKVTTRESGGAMDSRVKELEEAITGGGSDNNQVGLNRQMEELRESLDAMKGDYDRMMEVGKGVLERLARLEEADSDKLSEDVSLVKRALKELVEETEAQLNEHSRVAQDLASHLNSFVGQSVAEMGRRHEALAKDLKEEAKKTGKYVYLRTTTY